MPNARVMLLATEEMVFQGLITLSKAALEAYKQEGKTRGDFRAKEEGQRWKGGTQKSKTGGGTRTVKMIKGWNKNRTRGRRSSTIEQGGQTWHQERCHTEMWHMIVLDVKLFLLGTAILSTGP